MKTAIATCPAGKKVYSTGSIITIASGTGGRVYTYQLYPNPTLDTVTAVGAEDATAGFSGTWSVTAQAICGDPVANLQRIKTSTAQSVGDSQVIQQISCPTNLKLYGSGFAIHQQPGLAFMQTTARNVTGYGYAADVDNAGQPGGWYIDGFIICGAEAPGYVQVPQSASPLDSSSPKTLVTQCPAGKKVHGASWHLIPNAQFGDLLVEEMSYTGSFSSYHVTAWENDSHPTNSWRIHGFLICANAS